jgi:tetratricopeptide (TPR) repeat protein
MSATYPSLSSDVATLHLAAGEVNFDLLESTHRTDLPDFDVTTKESRPPAEDSDVTLGKTPKPALDETEEAHRLAERWDSLVEHYLTRLDTITDVVSRGELLCKVARVFDEKLEDPTQATEALLIALEENPRSVEILQGLAELQRKASQWKELGSTLTRLQEVLVQRLPLVTDPEEVLATHLALASLYEVSLSDPGRAAASYRSALESEPSNLLALRGLARADEILGEWTELESVLEAELGLLATDHERLETWVRLADLREGRLLDFDGAFDAYRTALDIEPANVRALERLAHLYDARGEVENSVDCLSRVADLAADGSARAEALYRLGNALRDKLEDAAAAEDRYEAALEIHPAHLPAIAALRQLAMNSGALSKAARYLEKEHALTTSERRRAQLLVELGSMYRELGDPESAQSAWEHARETDPDNADAASLLLEVYLASSEAAKAEPLLDRVVARASAEGRDAREAQSRLGHVCLALGKDEKAKRVFLAASEALPREPSTVAGLAEACVRLRDWNLAASSYQTLLSLLGERDFEARADAHGRLGLVQREQGLPREALQSFDRALDADRAHRPTLEALVRFHTEAKEWSAVVAYKYRILDGIVGEEEQFTTLMEIGELWQEKAKDPEHAIFAFEDALRLRPDSRPLVHRLLGLYQTTEKWKKLIDTLEASVAAEQDPIVRSKFLYTLAQLYRDKEDDPAHAVALFDAALDLDPTHLEAFERINRILTSQRNWHELERSFRKMIHRRVNLSPRDSNLEYHLWHSLGLIHRDRLKSAATAAECFRMATSCKSGEVGPHRILAELYEAADHVEGAVHEHGAVLRADPTQPDPYRGLFRIYMRVGEYDRAWCASAALAFLGKASDDERGFFETYRRGETHPPRGRLDNELWIGRLFHPDENLFVGKIFDLITPAAMALKASQLLAAHQFPVLDSRFKESEATSTLPFTRAFVHTAYVLGLPRPELYVRSDVPGGLVAVPSTPPASVAGQAVLAGLGPHDLAFMAGKHVSGYRGEHYIRNLFPRLPELKVLLFAAISLALEAFPVPEELRGTVQGVAGLLAQRLDPLVRDSLGLVVTKFLEEGGNVDLKRWMAAADLTGCRAGLLVSSDLESAKRILYAEPQLPGELSPADKMKELLAFSVSEPYFTLRQALRITIAD